MTTQHKKKEIKTKKKVEEKIIEHSNENQLKIKILKCFIDNSISIGFVLGLIAIVFSVFKEIFFPLVLFIFLLSIINVIFVKRTKEEEFYFLISITALIVVSGNFFQYLPSIISYLAIDQSILNKIAPYGANTLILIVISTIIPAIKSIVKLVFTK